MNSSLQSKLLRVLQERVVTPVGSAKSKMTNARFLSATHQNLAAQVIRGNFREDLYFRLNVIEVAIPPLRERTDDILPLARSFLKRASNKHLSGEAISKLMRYDWPGNVRELKNVVEKAAILSAGQVISADSIQLSGLHSTSKDIASEQSGTVELPTAVAELERSLITSALRKADFNRSEAARILKIGRQLLYAKMKEYGIECPKDI